MLKRIGPEFQWFKGLGRNSNGLKDRAGILMVKRIGPDFQWSKR